jgi:putative nucleotidyltransferase with HDIG domain
VVSRFDPITAGQLNLLAILANTASSAIANHSLYQDLQASYLHAISGLANSIEARDSYTAGHTERVSILAEILARRLGWNESRIRNLRMGCTLHDIGKIGVPDSILNKPGALTKEELAKMRSHPAVGLKIIRGIELFQPAVPYIGDHHENFDGSGYPRGLKGEEISIEGRLLAIADTFDAILSDRPYRKGREVSDAVSELLENRGRQFDPLLVDLFLEVLVNGGIEVGEMYNRTFDTLAIQEMISATSRKVSV